MYMNIQEIIKLTHHILQFRQRIPAHRRSRILLLCRCINEI